MIETKTKIGISAGIIAALALLTLIPGAQVTYKNWETCKQISPELDHCYAKITFKLNQSVYFSINDGLKESSLNKRTASTLWLNTSSYGFIRTDTPIVVQAFQPTTKAQSTDRAPDGRYIKPLETGYTLTKGKSKDIYIRGIKHPGQRIEWKQDLFGIDPVWDATRINLTFSACDDLVMERIATPVGKQTVNHGNGTIEIQVVYNITYTPWCNRYKKIIGGKG